MNVKLLLIHQGFPGQFRHLIPILKSRGDEIWAIGTPRKREDIPQGVNYVNYKPKQGNGKDTFPLASELETKVIRGEAVGRAAQKLAKGKITGIPWTPDLIIGHPGWGEMLFLGDIWPEVPQLHYVEFFHGVPGTDNDIPDQYATIQTWEERARARIKNTNLLTNLNQMQRGISPTKFQYSLLPNWAKQRTEVIHDGINTDWLSPDSSARLKIPATSKLPNGLVIKPGDPVITFVNRTFEPYRGIHIFLEALAQLQACHPTAQAVLVGANTPNVSYGAKRKDGLGWLTYISRQMGDRLDWRRIHAIGQVPHSVLRDVYRVSSAHVYLSYPFVLSWSLLEAMSCEALVIGSKTSPVEELIKHKQTGLIVPFEDATALKDTLVEALKNPKEMQPIRSRARKHIQNNYELKSCLKNQLALIDSMTRQIKY